MKHDDYKAMLKAVEQALQICRESVGRMDAQHQKICEDLADARKRLVQLVNSAQGGTS